MSLEVDEEEEDLTCHNIKSIATIKFRHNSCTPFFREKMYILELI